MGCHKAVVCFDCRDKTERPIIFSGPMVRAILDGTKTQTRRVVKVQPSILDGRLMHHVAGPKWESGLPYRCPYGCVKDRLWVRETFNKCGCFVCVDHWPKRGTDHGVTYQEGYRGCSGLHWTPSIHMPRWASRITLEITEIRVQRVQDINASDAQAEGISVFSGDVLIRPGTEKLSDAIYRDQFSLLWNSINDKRGFGWARNPWVWAITFKRI